MEANDYALDHLSYHLYYAGLYPKLYAVMEEGLLDLKLARFGDPTAVVDDYDYAFLACEDEEALPQMVTLGLRRSSLASQAHLLMRDLEEPISILAREDNYHHWLTWCLGLSELLPDALDRVRALSKLSTCCRDEAELEKVFQRIRRHAEEMHLDTLSSMALRQVISVLKTQGPNGILLCIETLLPLLRGKRLLSLFGAEEAVNELAEAINALPADNNSTQSMQLKAALETAKERISRKTDPPFPANDQQGDMEVMNDSDYAKLKASLDRWNTQIERVRTNLDGGDSNTRCHELLQNVLDDIRSCRTPFEAWQPLVEIAHLWKKLGTESTAVIQVLNESLIAAYRSDDDSDRCNALCSIAKAASKLGHDLITDRVVDQAIKHADNSSSISHRVAQLCDISKALWEIGQQPRAVELTRRAIGYLTDLQDFSSYEFQRRIEVLPKLLTNCEELRLADQIPQVVNSFLNWLEDPNERDDRRRFLSSLADIVLKLRDPTDAIHIIDETTKKLTSAKQQEEIVYLSSRLINELENASDELQNKIKFRVLADLPHLIAEAEAVPNVLTYISIVQNLGKICISLGDLGHGNEVLNNCWKRSQETRRENRHSLIIPVIQLAAELGRFELCDSAIRLLFNDPLRPSHQNSVMVLRLAARAHQSHGNSTQAEQMLTLSEKHAEEIANLAQRAEEQAHIGSEWYLLGKRDRAVVAVESAIASLRELGQQIHGHDPYAAIASACGLLGDNANGVRLLTDALNTTLAGDNTITVEQALVHFGSACEDLRDHESALKLLDRLESIGHKVIDRMQMNWMTVSVLTPLHASRSVVLYQSGKRDAALNVLTGAIRTAQGLLSAKSPSNKEFFVSTALQNICRVCAKLSDWKDAKDILAEIESIAGTLSKEKEFGMPNVERDHLYCSVAEALLSFGEKERARSILEPTVNTLAQHFGAGLLFSEVLRLFIAPLLVAEGTLRMDILQRITRAEHLEDACEEICNYAKDLSREVVMQICFAFSRLSSQLDSIVFVRIIMRLCEPLARHLPSDQIEIIIGKMLERMNLRSDPLLMDFASARNEAQL